MDVKKIVEAVLFSVDEPIKLSEISEKLNIGKKDVYKAIKSLKEDYDKNGNAMEITKIGQRYVMQLREDYLEIAYRFSKPELDKDVLKTLAVIAYYQPIKQSDLREMVGEKIYDHVNILKSKNLVTTRTSGKTLLISVTKNFGPYFGIDISDPKSIKEYLAKKLNLNLDGDTK
ncbi:MAG: SMC-Scp complex subunit ScpB [Thermoplasmata archaeon]|nr:SMC-Scp complex subunit ScpB [Thermoplasmata archaeon]